MEEKHLQMSESFFLTAILAIVGGFLDSYSYLMRGHVFANAQTGNIVLFGVNLQKRDFTQAFYYFVPILAFAVGVILVEIIKHFYKEEHKIHWRQRIVALEFVLITVVGFIPLGQYDVVANVLISFVCSMQVETFRRVHGHPFASTMCIGNLRSGTAALSVYLREKKPEQLEMSLYYFGVILFFAVGAGIGGVLSVHLGFPAIWVSSGLLLISFLLMFKDRLEKDVHELEGDLEEDIQKLGTQLREEIKK